MSRTLKKNEQGAEYNKDLMKELIKCQKEIDKINEKTSDEMLDVEQKYEELRKPLYKRRSVAIKRLPDFWGTAFIKHPQLVGYMGKKGLHSLRTLEVKHFKKVKKGYRIYLHFDENPYFENKVLTKVFRFGKSKKGNWISSDSTPINWKEGKNLLLEKQDDTSTLYKNFFDWFSDNTNPNFDHIGDYIRDDLWINPLRYYCIETQPEENATKENPEIDDDGKEDDGKADDGKADDDNNKK